MTETILQWEWFASAENTERDRFEVDDDSKATWAMRKLLALRTRAAEVKSIADGERQRIQAWQDQENEKLDRDLEYFEALLTRYAAAQRETQDRKSISTPYGTVKSRLGQPKYVVEQQEFLEWAEVNAPALIRVKREADLPMIKEILDVSDGHAITEDGEIVPGLMVVEPTVNYTIETA